MDADVSQALFNECGFLILLDVPEGTEVGIDYNSWNTGPKFKGIKMIPPGFHFIYYSAVSKEGQTAPRTGFFHFFQSKEVLVKRWNPIHEELTDKDIDCVLIDRIKFNLKDLDRSLGPYPFDSMKKWTSLTNHISQPLVERIQPLNKEISSVTQVSSPSKDESDPQTSASQPTKTPQGPDPSPVVKKDLFFAGVGFFPVEESTEDTMNQKPSAGGGGGTSCDNFKMAINSEAALRFSNVSAKNHPLGATPTEITQHNMDLSYSLETFLKCNYDNNIIGALGELQLAFICFIVGQVYEAFEQWKRLVNLLCQSEESMARHTQLYHDLISVLHFQLREIPDDFFVDIVSRDNFLTKTLQVFFVNVLNCEGLDKSLVKKAIQFKENLTKKYQWDFTSEPDEDAPVIVEFN